LPVLFVPPHITITSSLVRGCNFFLHSISDRF
jgi:hypothetical protein